MKVIKNVCNRCGTVIDEGKGVKVKLQVTVENGMPVEIEKDFCKSCYAVFGISMEKLCVAETEVRPMVPDTGIMVMAPKENLEPLNDVSDDIADAVFEDKVVKPLEKKRKGKKPVDNAKSKDSSYKTGPFQKDELYKLYKRFENGDTIEDIAKDTGRKIGSINRMHTRWTKLHNSEEEPEETTLPTNTEDEKSEENKDLDFQDDEPEVDDYLEFLETQTGRKIDVGKIFALHNAGWSVSKIKYEMSLDAPIIESVIEHCKPK